MKIITKISAIGLMALGCAPAFASDVVTDGGLISVSEKGISRFETPFSNPGVVSNKDVDAKIVGDTVFITFATPTAMMPPSTDIYIYDQAAKQGGKTASIKLSLYPNKGAPSDFKVLSLVGQQ